MTSTVKIIKLMNLSEIAREAGYTPQYVHMLLKGERKSPKALAKVQTVIKETLGKIQLAA